MFKASLFKPTGIIIAAAIAILSLCMAAGCSSAGSDRPESSEGVQPAAGPEPEGVVSITSGGIAGGIHRILFYEIDGTGYYFDVDAADMDTVDSIPIDASASEYAELAKQYGTRIDASKCPFDIGRLCEGIAQIPEDATLTAWAGDDGTGTATVIFDGYVSDWIIFDNLGNERTVLSTNPTQILPDTKDLLVECGFESMLDVF